tara:strand:- start:1767 stop:2150 length:384 start_codon:yes stop_codon:yes gene_type:complete
MNNKTIVTLAVSSAFVLASCTPLTWIPGIGGGGNSGPSLTAVGTQMAAEANQQIVADQSNIRSEGGDIEVHELEDTVTTRDVESIRIMNQDIPPWVIIALILGWLAPSPREMGRGLISLFTTGRRRA